MRRINLHFDSAQYYQIAVPAIQDIARWVMSLRGRYQNLPLQPAKRDIASPFRLLRLRPAMVLLMVTEFPAAHFDLGNDLLRFYLVMPFGRNAPGAFRVILGCSRLGTSGTWHYAKRLFVSRFHVADVLGWRHLCRIILSRPT